MAGVVLENVSRVYPGGVAAVEGIRLEVRDREFLVLVGPSGCGKTTTLRLIAGLEDLSSGTITIGSRVVNDVPPKDRDIAMVFQNYALYPHLSVYRNLAFGLELREGTSGIGRLWRWALPPKRKQALAERRFAIARRVHDAARILGIEDLLERYPRQLSGGERQRVALGRAIVRNPAVFLFDEPLSNLDAKLRVEMRRELKQLHQRLRTTMIYVTHDQVEALTLGERIVVMNDGMIQQIGPPMEVYDWPANRFVAGFIGTPAMNFIAGDVTLEAGRPRFVRGRWSVAIDRRSLGGGSLALTSGDRQAALLGVRPEDVRIERAVADAPGAIPAVVGLVEMLGDATVATLELNDDRAQHDAAKNADSQDAETKHAEQATYVLSKGEPRTDLQAGQQVALHLATDKLHLFDPATGENWVRRPVAA